MAELPKKIMVRATQRGFLHWIRNIGEEFEILEHHFSSFWMEKVEPAAPAPAPAPVAGSQPAPNPAPVAAPASATVPAVLSVTVAKES